MAARELDGTPLVASDSSMVVLHRGLAPTSPGNVFDSVCCPQDLAIGVDGSRGAVWLAWTKPSPDKSLCCDRRRPPQVPRSAWSKKHGA